ncbi:MAG: (Fe-S)-binding protein [Planctomycetota bacterium]|jgi:Fe-S oxidoreductase
MTGSILEILKRTGALACLDCGKCTAICPVSRHSGYSPRLAVTLLSGGDTTPDSGLWDCLTCDRCNLECPSDVHFGEMVGQVRRLVFGGDGFEVPCAHGGALQSMMRLSASPDAKPDRSEWIPPNARVAEKGEVLYFVGCLPHFETFFEDFGLDLSATGRATLRILNTLDVVPVVLPEERCCGHDLLWAGDEETYLRLADHNLEAIRRSGAKTVVFSCAECYHTFRFDLAERLGSLPFDSVHITEYIASRLGAIRLRSLPRKVTYHDPCRLGRLSGIYKAPRILIDAVPDLQAVEMAHSHARAACCGTSLWAACGAVPRTLQLERLAEAADTGADTLLTTCPKCRIHFACARSGQEKNAGPGIVIRDLIELFAEALAK